MKLTDGGEESDAIVDAAPETPGGRLQTCTQLVVPRLPGLLQVVPVGVDLRHQPRPVRVLTLLGEILGYHEDLLARLQRETLSQHFAVIHTV